jgi:ABC-type multidrug transport system fused ATPase/permease subunit
MNADSRTLFLWSVLKPHRKPAVLLISLSLLASAWEGFSIALLVPLLSALQEAQNHDQLPRVLKVIARLLEGYPFKSQALVSIGLIVAAIMLKNLFLALSIYIGYGLTTRLVVDLRSRAMDTLLQAGIGFHNNARIGHLVEKVLNHTAMIDQLVKQAIDFLVNATAFLVLLGLLLLFSWQLTLFTIVLAAGIALAVSRYVKTLSGLGRKSARSGEELAALLYETLGGIQVIKSFTKESSQSAVLKDKISEHGKNQQSFHVGNYLIHIVTEVVGVVSIALLLIVALLTYDVGDQLLLARLLPFLYVLTRLFPVIKNLNQARGAIVSRWPYVETVHDLLRWDNKPMVKDGARPYPGLTREIRFDAVSFSYLGERKRALVETAFSIPKGATTAIVGKSGAGKSTIINLLLRFYDPQEGAILVDGVPLQHFQLRSYRERIGLVSQDTFIFNDTVANNIAFGALAPPAYDKVVAAAERAGAHEFILDLAQGYDTMLGDRGVRLSGGQRQRISIARAILRDPEILILDEATSSLDAGTERLIHDAMTDLSRNRTVVIIAHRLSTLSAADQIIVLKAGRVAESGKQRQLLEKKGEYYDLIKPG